MSENTFPSEIRILYVVNPAGQGGAGLAAWKDLGGRVPFPPGSRIALTKHPGHARDIARTATGFSILVAVGGDGTFGDVLSGIMDRPGARPRLALLPTGTGNDCARSLKMTTVESALAALEARRERAVDVMRIEYQVEGKPRRRHAFLLGNVGFSPNSMIRPWMKRLLRSTGAYYLGTLLQIARHQSPRMTIQWDGGEHRGPTLVCVVSNTEYTGGGSMRLAPGARFDDGVLNLSIIPARSRWSMLRALPKIASGTHIQEPHIRYLPATRVRVESTPEAVLDIDGEVAGCTPATFTVLPGAVSVLAPELPPDGQGTSASTAR